MAIYVWGTGCGASELIRQGLDRERITAFVDNHPSGDTYLGLPVVFPHQLRLNEEDLVIVTTRHADAVEEDCKQLGIDRQQVLYLKNACQLSDRNLHCPDGEAVLGTALYRRLFPRQRIVPTPCVLLHSDLPESDLENDYVRLSTLELLCRRVQALPGAAAEVGVYQGSFAMCINRLLPGKSLYLFDSFAGFSQDDNPSEEFQQAHTHTSPEDVLARMPFPERVALFPGFFPETARDLKETFCLVSLDVDFYDSTLEGLRWFWPRMVPGGYLLIHDYNSESLPGVAHAVKDFEKEMGVPLPMFPLPDIGGSMIVAKI